MYAKRKSICIIFVGIVIMCILGACTADGSAENTENQESNNIAVNEPGGLTSEADETVLQDAEDTDSEQSEDVIIEHDENMPLGIDERYKSILLSEGGVC